MITSSLCGCAGSSNCACWLAAMARASNSASIPEVVKCIRANFDSFELLKESNPEKVVALYKEFLLDLLQVTSRPLKNLLSKSLLKAFEKVPKSEADFWANQIVAAVQYCRSKSKSMTSGNKTSPAVTEVVKVLVKPGSFHLPIWKGATRSPHKKKVKLSPGKVKRKVSAESQSTSSKPTLGTRESILASYGLNVEKSPEKETLVVSSSEEGSCAETPASGSAGSLVAFFDQQLLCMKRVLPGGKEELACMREGSGGFLEFQWPKSSIWELSEVPNLVLNAPGQAASAESTAKAKVKAKGKAKAKSKSSAKRKAKGKAKVKAKAASPVAKAAAKAAPVAAAKAAASTSGSSELVLHNLRITKASKPPRTYLTGCTCGGSGPHKPRLIVEYSERKDGVNHESKCNNAKEHIISQKLGYSAARDIRNLFPQ